RRPPTYTQCAEAGAARDGPPRPGRPEFLKSSDRRLRSRRSLPPSRTAHAAHALPTELDRTHRTRPRGHGARGMTARGQPSPAARTGVGRLVGGSAAIASVRAAIVRVAAHGVTVLVQGETGTGKELVARAIHEESRRDPFVSIALPELSEGVLESELFGHRRGAFTGAVRERAGLFEAASGGTLFLDEIGDAPASVQVKLLRALESREVRRV